MARPTKKKVHARAAVDASIEKRKSLILWGMRAALAALISGLPYTTLAVVCYILGVKPASRYYFDIGVNAITNALVDEAQSSAKKYFDLMEPNATVSFDASWSHKRNAKICIADIIDIKSEKIIAFTIIDKLLQDKFANYKGASNMMEAFGFEELIPKLKESNKIRTLIKDGDTKIKTIIEKYNWTVRLVSDINHKFKNFHTSFQEINNRYNHSLRGLEVHLKSWLGEILFSNATTESKVALWNNTIAHYLGNHEKCLHKDTPKPWKNAKNPIAVKALEEVIQTWMPTVNEFIRGQTTNYNEVFHSVKARFFNKNFNYGKSSVARICASILQYNEGYKWIVNVLKRIHMKILPLHTLNGIFGLLATARKKEDKKMEKIHSSPEESKKRKQKKSKEYKEESAKNALKHK